MTYENVMCPACGASPGRLAADPQPDDATVCTKCGTVAIFTDDGLRPANARESAALDREPRVLRVRAMVVLNKVLAEEMITDGDLRAIGIEFRTDADGLVEIISASEDLTEEEAEQARQRLQENEIDRRVDDISLNVTAEVANHVLAVHGDEEASWPPMAVSALIHLIKVCRESNDEMLAHIDHCGVFHGYVLAMTMVGMEDGTEVGSGRRMLRKLAGLDPLNDGSRRPAEAAAAAT